MLELACGPGTWTTRLLRRATSLTAVDAAPEMLGLAARQIPDPRVRFVAADLFGWRPDHGYDVVFFGFWLSHVPDDRFETFWSTDALRPSGRVLFFDDGQRSPDELAYGSESTTIRRRLTDGRPTGS